MAAPSALARSRPATRSAFSPQRFLISVSTELRQELEVGISLTDLECCSDLRGRANGLGIMVRSQQFDQRTEVQARALPFLSRHPSQIDEPLADVRQRGFVTVVGESVKRRRSSGVSESSSLYRAAASSACSASATAVKRRISFRHSAFASRGGEDSRDVMSATCQV